MLGKRYGERAIITSTINAQVYMGNLGDVLSILITAIENIISNPSLNTGRGSLHFPFV